jgi:hypothetical protein
MTLCQSGSSHIRKTCILNIISIHKQGVVDRLLVVELDAKQSALVAESNRQPILRANRAPRPDTLHLLDEGRGEKKEPVFPNEI